MKYIFMAGAPGSKWSSVSKNIYFSPSIDRSDSSPDREYYQDASSKLQLMHTGAYFDPGMEFGDFFDKLDQHTKEECEAEFDRPFTGQGVRIIKSHVFSHHIDYIKKTWPDCPIILIHRDNDACLGWWVRSGHFNITYPNYNKYYKDLKNMAQEIDAQNKDILTAWNNYTGTEPETNMSLAYTLGIYGPPDGNLQNYKKLNIKVKVV